MAIADYLRKLIELKNQLVANLNSMGVTADESEKLNTLVPKVLDIETGVDTSDATATAEDIRVGKTAYVNDVKIDGVATIPNIEISSNIKLNVEFTKAEFESDSSTFNGFTASVLIEELILPNTITKIVKNNGDEMFPNIKKVVIPNSVTSIERTDSNIYGMFGAKTSMIKSVVIPNSVQYIKGDSGHFATSSERQAIVKGSILDDITLPCYIASYSDVFFYDGDHNNDSNYAGGARKVIFSALETNTTVASQSFAGMNKSVVYEVELLEGITNIESDFSNKKYSSYRYGHLGNMKSIYLPSSLIAIASGAFNNCPALTDVYFAGTEEEWNRISISNNNSYLINATIHYNYVPE